MRPEPAGLARRGEVVARTEIEENVGGLTDQQLSGSEKRRGEGRVFDLLAVEQAQHLALPTRRPGDIDIVGPSLLERQADELAAPLDPVPVIELVPHRGAPFPVRWPGRAQLARRQLRQT